jgi:hypothetical protein
LVRGGLVFDSRVLTGIHAPEGFDGGGFYLKVFQNLDKDVANLGT